MLRWFLPAILVLMQTACSGPYSTGTVNATDTGRPPTVQVKTLEVENIPEVISATGELLAEDEATLRAKVPGRVAKLYVDLGSRVNEGDPIAELEKEDYDLRLRQAEASVEQTRARIGLGPGNVDTIDPEKTSIVRQAAASLKEATLMYNNANELFKKGIVSNVDFQRADVALQGAEARRQAAIEEVYRTIAEIRQHRHEAALAKQQLSDTVIRAPFRGAITQRIATLGEYLAVNAPAVVLVRWHPLRVRLSVPERQAYKVKAGQRIDLTLAGQATPQPGHVVRISPAIEAQNRSLTVEGEAPNEDGRLRAGSFVEATIVVNPDARGIAVPMRAILSFAGVDRVFAVSGNSLENRQIRQGRRLSGERVEVAEGLKPGDRIVLEPSDRFTPGMKVEVAGR